MVEDVQRIGDIMYILALFLRREGVRIAEPDSNADKCEILWSGS
jgi:hypothetical protein